MVGEVEQLIITGDIQHPGLEQRIVKIRGSEQRIENVRTQVPQVQIKVPNRFDEEKSVVNIKSK